VPLCKDILSSVKEVIFVFMFSFPSVISISVVAIDVGSSEVERKVGVVVEETVGIVDERAIDSDG